MYYTVGYKLTFVVGRHFVCGDKVTKAPPKTNLRFFFVFPYTLLWSLSQRAESDIPHKKFQSAKKDRAKLCPFAVYLTGIFSYPFQFAICLERMIESITVTFVSKLTSATERSTLSLP